MTTPKRPPGIYLPDGTRWERNQPIPSKFMPAPAPVAVKDWQGPASFEPISARLAREAPPKVVAKPTEPAPAPSKPARPALTYTQSMARYDQAVAEANAEVRRAAAERQRRLDAQAYKEMSRNATRNIVDRVWDQPSSVPVTQEQVPGMFRPSAKATRRAADRGNQRREDSYRRQLAEWELNRYAQSDDAARNKAQTALDAWASRLPYHRYRLPSRLDSIK